MKFFLVLLNSYKKVYENYIQILLISILDLIFFFVLGVSTSGFQLKILGQLDKINELVQNFVPSLYNTFPLETFKQHFYLMMKYFLAMLLLAFLIWVIFQGLNWFRTNLIVKRKVVFIDYMKKFGLINLVWFVFFCLYFYGVFMLSFETMLGNIALIQQSTILSVGFFLFLGLLYFAFISVGLCEKMKFFDLMKKSFVLGYKKFFPLFSGYVFILLKISLLAYLFYLLTMSALSFFLLMVFFILPTVAWSRIFFAMLIEKEK